MPCEISPGATGMNKNVLCFKQLFHKTSALHSDAVCYTEHRMPTKAHDNVYAVSRSNGLEKIQTIRYGLQREIR
jgi:hypothetical protein